MLLTKIIEEIKKVQPLAEENVDAGPFETMNARRGRKLQAIESLNRLRTAYTTELRRTAAFIVVLGDQRDAFTKLAVDGFKCYEADPDAYFSHLVDRVPQTVYLRESLANAFDVLGRYIEDSAHELDIVGYPQLIFRQEYQRTVKSREDFIGVVRQAVVEQIGGEIVGIQAARSLTPTAIQKENSAKFTPILLPTGDERFGLTVARDLERISTRVFLVVAGKTNADLSKLEDAIFVTEPSKEDVKKALKTISSQLKK